jgi:hypothetical protein
LTNLDPDGFVGSTWTLPNGLRLERTDLGYGNINISTGPSLSFNGTDAAKAVLFNFFIIHFDVSGDGVTYKARAYEILMHWCVNTYDVRVSDNIPSMDLKASHSIFRKGEAFVKSWNQTVNTTYLVTPEDEGFKYVAGGMGPDGLWHMLNSTLCGYDIYYGDRNLDSGTQAMMTGIRDAKIDILTQPQPVIEEAEYAAVRGMTTNIANGLTNAYVVPHPYIRSKVELISFMQLIIRQYNRHRLAPRNIRVHPVGVAQFRGRPGGARHFRPPFRRRADGAARHRDCEGLAARDGVRDRCRGKGRHGRRRARWPAQPASSREDGAGGAWGCRGVEEERTTLDFGE